MTITLLKSEYYRKAILAIPPDDPNRDEIVSLLIDQVIDDYQWQHHTRSTNRSNLNASRLVKD